MRDQKCLSNASPRLVDLVVLAGLAAAIHGWIVLTPSAIMGFTDALDYLLLADYFRELAYGSPSARAEQLFAATRYPPLYPALLGLFGGGSDHQHVAMVVSNAVAVVAVAALWLWAHREYGRISAAVLAAATLLYPQYFLLNLHTVSEPLSIVFIATALLLISGRGDNKRLVLLGIAIAAMAPLVRAANLPILPAVAVALAMKGSFPRGRLALLMILAIMPSGLWYLGRALAGAETYTASLSPHFMLAQMGGWPDALWLQPIRLFTALVDNWGNRVSTLGFILGICIAGLAGIGCLARARKGHADAWFLLFYISVVIVWPYPAEFQRLLVPVYPFALGCVIHALLFGARDTASREAASLSPRGLPVLAVAILVVQWPAMMRFTHRAMMTVDAELVVDKRRVEFFTLADDEQALRQIEKYARVRGVAKATRDALPSGACVYAADPRLLMTQGGVSAISYPPGIEHSNEARDTLVRCDYFFVSAFGMSALGIGPGYPMPQLAEWTTPILVSQQAFADRIEVAAALFVRKWPRPPMPP